MKLFKTVLLCVMSVMLAMPAMAAGKRLALVIGNSAYKFSPLRNPVNDASDVADALGKLGFEVIKKTDVTRKDMRNALREFSEKLGKEDIGLFYFAGHGMQVDGTNYLIPTDADVEAEDEIEDEAVDANAILRKMKASQNKLNIVILDACRNNPFKRSFRSGGRGLARMDGPVGSIIAYATAPGDVAADGTERNGVYTKHFLEALKVPNLSVEQVFKMVRTEVESETAGKQIPWESSSLKGEFKFNIQINITNTNQNDEQQNVDKDRPSRTVDPSLELTFWNDVKNSNTIAMLDAYLKRFPKGTYSELARIKKEQLLEKSPKQNSNASGVEMVKQTVAKFPVTIEVLPANATVKITNLEQPYKDGIKLSAGLYKVQVSLPGYASEMFDLKVDSAAVSKLVSLKKQGSEVEVVGTLDEAYKFYDAEQYDKAFPIFLYLTNRGEEEAHNHIAWLYMKGYGTKQDYAKALQWYTASANRGDAWAEQKLGYMYREGLGGAVDYEKALLWYRKAAAQDNVDALANMGYMYQQGYAVEANDQEALKWYMKAAEKGDDWAQFKVGYFYDTGKGVAQDYALAAHWYEKSSDQGNDDAMNNLGLLYEFGRGVPQSYDKAYNYYQKAAMKGHKEGMDNLGVLLEAGNGVAQNYEEAFKWYTKSAELGYYDAQKRLGYLYMKGLGTPLDYDKAIYWYLQAAKQDDAWSQQKMGYMYLNGYGVAQDYEQAKYWFTKAAKQNDLDAASNLGWMYHKGLGVTVDYKQALSWYLKAAEQNDSWAQHKVGYFYDEGLGTAKDYVTAREWYLKAADQGNMYACYNLGLIYENGDGVAKNLVEAERWFKKADELGYADAKTALDRIKQQMPTL